MTDQNEDRAYIRANIERLERLFERLLEDDSGLIPIDKIKIILEGYRKSLREMTEE